MVSHYTVAAVLTTIRPAAVPLYDLLDALWLPKVYTGRNSSLNPRALRRTCIHTYASMHNTLSRNKTFVEVGQIGVRNDKAVRTLGLHRPFEIGRSCENASHDVARMYVCMLFARTTTAGRACVLARHRLTCQLVYLYIQRLQGCQLGQFAWDFTCTKRTHARTTSCHCNSNNRSCLCASAAKCDGHG